MWYGHCSFNLNSFNVLELVGSYLSQMKSLSPLHLSFSFFFFFWFDHSIWKFPGQGLTHATAVTPAAAVTIPDPSSAESQENSSSVLLWTEILVDISLKYTVFKLQGLSICYISSLWPNACHVLTPCVKLPTTPRIDFIVSIHRCGKWGLKTLNNLPIVTQIVNGRSKMWAIISTLVRHYLLLSK